MHIIWNVRGAKSQSHTLNCQTKSHIQKGKDFLSFTVTRSKSPHTTNRLRKTAEKMVASNISPIKHL